MLTEKIKADILRDVNAGFVLMPGGGYPPKCKYNGDFLTAHLNKGIRTFKVLRIGTPVDTAKNNRDGIATRNLNYRCNCTITDGTVETQCMLHLGQITQIGTDGTLKAAIDLTWADRLETAEARAAHTGSKWFTFVVEDQPATYTPEVIEKAFAVIESFVSVGEPAEMK